MNKLLDDLVTISRKFGKDPNFIIAGGGNTSFKDDEKIWVKASGTSMADITEEGFVCLDREKLKSLSTKKYSNEPAERERQVKEDLAEAILYPEGKRPSVETSMHEVIAYPFVVHTHPTYINGMLCAQGSKDLVRQVFGNEVVYVPYTDPGYVLFKAVDEALSNFRNEKGTEPSVIFLENHGVFVGANSMAEIESIYDDLSRIISNLVKVEPPNSVDIEVDNEQYIAEIKQMDEFKSAVIISDQSMLTQHFVKSHKTFQEVAIPFTPDNIVYCKSQYLFMPQSGNLTHSMVSFKEQYGYWPKVIAIEGKGLFAIEESEKSAQIVMDVFKDMMNVSFLAQNFGGPRPMTPAQIEFIDNWEVENYRRQVSKKN